MRNNLRRQVLEAARPSEAPLPDAPQYCAECLKKYIKTPDGLVRKRRELDWSKDAKYKGKRGRQRYLAEYYRRYRAEQIRRTREIRAAYAADVATGRAPVAEFDAAGGSQGVA